MTSSYLSDAAAERRYAALRERLVRTAVVTEDGTLAWSPEDEARLGFLPDEHLRLLAEAVAVRGRGRRDAA